MTPANTDERTSVPKLLQQLFGKVFADKGYVSQKLAKQLLNTAGIQLITQLKRNMKPRLMPLNDRLLLRQRSIIETIIDQLKNISLPIVFAPSLFGQLLCQSSERIDCLLPSAKEACDRHRP